MTGGRSIFELRQVTRSFGDATAVRAFDLAIQPRKISVLIGPSGCGKSTVLRLLLGLILPDEGEIHFEGQELSTRNVLELRQRMGYVIQDGGLFPHLTAHDNAALMAGYLGWEPGRVEERMAELAELTSFPVERLDHFPAQLSGGQKQRVSLMRALMLDPDVLLLDEPLGALDPMIRADLQVDLKQIFRKLGKTVVLVTHDMDEAAFFGDIIVLMRDGRVVQAGPLQELLDSPAEPFVTNFIQAQRSPLNAAEEEKP